MGAKFAATLEVMKTANRGPDEVVDLQESVSEMQGRLWTSQVQLKDARAVEATAAARRALAASRGGGGGGGGGGSGGDLRREQGGG